MPFNFVFDNLSKGTTERLWSDFQDDMVRKYHSVKKQQHFPLVVQRIINNGLRQVESAVQVEMELIIECDDLQKIWHLFNDLFTLHYQLKYE